MATVSLGEALPQEIARVMKIRDEYLKIPEGAIAAELMRLSILNANKASTEGDVIGMMRAYEDLKGYEL